MLILDTLDDRSHICNSKFSNSHTEKSKKKQMKFILIIYFILKNTCFYLMQYIKIFSFQYKIIKILSYFNLFLIRSLWNPVYILFLQHISIPTSYISSAQKPLLWLVTTILDSVALTPLLLLLIIDQLYLLIILYVRISLFRLLMRFLFPDWTLIDSVSKAKSWVFEKIW